MTGIVGTAVSAAGSGAMLPALQRQAGVSIPPWLLLLPFVPATLASVVWVVDDSRGESSASFAHWSQTNWQRLLHALIRLGVALALFRAGTNYNWVTTLAIVVTIAHWIGVMTALEGNEGQGSEGISRRRR